jgi:transcription initiation factor TFIIIB Brf1 subunit/transcription initiation factor TFIIB
MQPKISSKFLVKQNDIKFIQIDNNDVLDYDDNILGKLIRILQYEELIIHLPYEDDDKFIHIENSVLTNDDCKFCGKKNSIRTCVSEGIRVCNNVECGKVITALFDEHPEWRQHQNDSSGEGMVRCSNNFVTNPGGYNKLKTLQNWLSMDHKERSMNKTLADITEKCTSAGIKKCAIDDIKGIYKEFVHGTVGDSTSTVRGLNKMELASAITMYACKKRGVPLLPDEIASIFNLNTNDITNGCRTFAELMLLKNKNYDMVNSTPEEYLMRLAPKLGIHKEFLDLASKIARNVKLINCCATHTPISVASGAILLTANIKKIDISVSKVSELFGISTTTSDKTMNEIEKYKKILVNDDKSKKFAKEVAKRRLTLGVIDDPS